MKEYLTVDVINDEELYVGAVSTFVVRVLPMIDEVRKKQSIPLNYRIKKIQEGWMGLIDILRSLSERCSPLDDRKSAAFFKFTDSISELGSPPIIKNSTLIYADDLESMSNLKEK